MSAWIDQLRAVGDQHSYEARREMDALWPLLLDAIQAAETLVEVTICRRFTMEFCRNRPELDRAEWCVTCDHAQRTADALGRLREHTQQ